MSRHWPLSEWPQGLAVYTLAVVSKTSISRSGRTARRWRAPALTSGSSRFSRLHQLLELSSEVVCQSSRSGRSRCGTCSSPALSLLSRSCQYKGKGRGTTESPTQYGNASYDVVWRCYTGQRAIKLYDPGFNHCEVFCMQVHSPPFTYYCEVLKQFTPSISPTDSAVTFMRCASVNDDVLPLQLGQLRPVPHDGLIASSPGY